jgi:hypothetical protein
MKVKHTLEFLICFFSRHDFIESPEHCQKVECRRCHQPYSHTLQEKLQSIKQVRIDENGNESAAATVPLSANRVKEVVMR